MGKLIDRTGVRYGRLLVLNRAGSNKRNEALWRCRCDCGGTVTVCATALSSGDTKSCGCLQRERFGKGRTTHGLSKHPLYNVWRNMKYRCYNRNDNNYHRYGGRGVTVCKAWREDFISFYKWAMENGYAEGLTIDRVRNNGNYTPSNCRFITGAENVSRNRGRGRRGRGYVCGVYQRKDSGKWTAQITTDEGPMWLGKTYRTKHEAVNAIKQAREVDDER